MKSEIVVVVVVVTLREGKAGNVVVVPKDTPSRQDDDA